MPATRLICDLRASANALPKGRLARLPVILEAVLRAYASHAPRVCSAWQLISTLKK